MAGLPETMKALRYGYPAMPRDPAVSTNLRRGPRQNSPTFPLQPRDAKSALDLSCNIVGPSLTLVSRYTKPEQFSVVTVDLPKLRDNDVLIKVKACGVCGTDLHIHEGEFIAKVSRYSLYIHSGLSTFVSSQLESSAHLDGRSKFRSG
jgi:hypothetical protein